MSKKSLSSESKAERRMLMNIALPIYVYTCLSVVYVVLCLMLPTCITKEDVVRHGRNNLLTYIMLVMIVVGNMRFRGRDVSEFPFILVGLFVKFFQLALYLTIFPVKKIYWLSFIGLAFVDLMLTLFEMFDKNNFRYTKERIDIDNQNDN